MKRIFQQSYRLVQWRVLSALIAVALASSARATDPIFINVSSAYYYVGGNTPVPPPVYDVTAFDNENIFSIDYQNFSLGHPFYETINTVFYTNNGTMLVNSPPQTNGFLSSALSNGFKFDLQRTNSHLMAGTFYNAGAIHSNSTNESNNIFDFGFGFGNFFILESLGFVDVYATNIINTGVINAGPDGRITLSSYNADLSYGLLTLEQPQSSASLFNGFGFFFNTAQGPANLSASGTFGVGFNFYPATSLGANYATSSVPNQIILSNSTAYIKTTDVGPTNRIVRAVFIMNDSPNVPYNVYFGSPANTTLGNGAATVEWTGIYQDAQSCEFHTNYLYLNDFYELVASTNLLIINGVPQNFTFTESSTPLMGGATVAPAGFSPIFQPAFSINPQYAYVAAQLIPGSVATNSSQSNPSGALTNIGGNIYISATNRLTLQGAQISGANYLSIYAPNQFDGSDGANIVAPYSDINLGVTNGRMNLANLIASGVQTLSGGLQAWSGVWTDADTNSGIFTDYRVAIISSKLLPSSKSWIQNLRLHATNSLVINDVMNVYKSLSIDATNLVLATNSCGNGLTSFSGELNWANTATFGPAQIPNVRWLTNNGAISAWNDSIFGASSTRYDTFINNGLIADNGTTIWTTNFVNSGNITNGSGGFTLATQRAVMTNGAVYANGNVSLTTSNLTIAREFIQAGRSLTIVAPDYLTDVPTNSPPGSGISSNIWVVGALANNGDGLSLAIKPAKGDLLGTIITNIAPFIGANKNIVDTWSGEDRGYSVTGFSNNAAIGKLVLDAMGTTASNVRFTFNGASVSNAIYVDCIEFRDYSTNLDASGNVQGITFNPNLVIYYAQAIRNGVTFAEKLNLKNTNNGVNNQTSHFRWLPTYVGYFSSTNLVYPDGSTNLVNAALAQSTQIDSDGDGIVNANDPTPFFISSQIGFSLTITNVPPRKARLTWQTIPNATNTVLFKTNLLSPNWSILTNFVSPQPYGSPASSVVVLDSSVTNGVARFYRICVQPLLTFPNPY